MDVCIRMYTTNSQEILERNKHTQLKATAHKHNEIGAREKRKRRRRRSSESKKNEHGKTNQKQIFGGAEQQIRSVRVKILLEKFLFASV